MAKTYDEWYRDIKKNNDALASSVISKYNKTVDDAVAKKVKENEQDISDIKKEYESAYDLNEIQRLINEKELNARMADLGLNNSGTNATGMTALQLGYTKQNTNITLSEQKAINTLRQKLNDYIASAEKDKTEYAIKVQKEYDDSAKKQAESIYKTEVTAASKSSSKSGGTSSNKSGGSGAAATKRTAVNDMKREFGSMYNQYGVFSDEQLGRMFSAIKNVEDAYNLTPYDCMTILSRAKLDYDQYYNWKKTGSVRQGIIGKKTPLIVPWSLRK